MGVREVRGSLAKMILSYVRRALGEEGVRAVLAAADRHRAVSELSGPGTWTSREDILVIAGAAADVCGDAEIGRRSGEEMMRVAHERGTVDFVRATGSVAAALEFTSNMGTKMSTGRVFELAEVGESHAVLVATYLDSSYPDPFFCGQAAGYYGLVPDLFGYSCAITEPECMCRGDERCVYRLTWCPDPASRDRAHRAEVEASKASADKFIGRFEQLHVMATELARAEEVDALLARVTELAGYAIDAPRYLLAVRDHEGGQLRIHHRGFEDEDRAVRYADRLLAGALEQNERCLIADVASGATYYGRLAAWYPKGSSATDMDRRLLGAYARHAAAALEAVASLEDARHDRDTATALLTLAESLAEVGSRVDVARRLAAAVPAVAACRSSGVWLWDGDSGRLSLEARFPETEDGPGAASHAFSTAEVDGLAALVRQPVPLFVRLDEAGPVVRPIMEAEGLRRCAVVPIVARGSFLGAVVAGFAEDVEDDDKGVLVRLGGLADQAATALDNADLLARLREQALHDALTGLPNRALLEDRVRQALLHIPRSGGHASLLFIDLDRFKNVNDTLGHEVGDNLIRQGAARLGGCLRATDTLARLGGDEFVALLPDTDGDAAALVADRMLGAMRRPFAVAARDVFVSCSVGIATAPEHGHDYPTLLRHADRAMYAAKQAGRSTYVVHSEDAICTREDRLALEGQLHTAVDKGELRLLYQPQIDLQTMRVAGVEALLRWDHPTLGRLGPDQFIPLAEESGLIAEIDEWVRETAFAQARRWVDAGTPLRVAVNLSTRVLRDARLGAHVAALLDRYRLSPELVELEVTDRVVMADDELPVVLAPLRALGVRLAVDDFGTGTSVLGRLPSGCIDVLKIDRSFIGAIESASAEAPLVSALLSIARSFGLDVVAEGVETAAQGAFLRRQGCQLAQGFYFSGAVEPEEIDQMLRRQVGRPAGGAAGAETVASSGGRGR